MSGIVGLLRLDGAPVESHQIEAMLRAIAHRGGPDPGVWVGDGIGLGQVTFASTPECAFESPPVLDETGLAVAGDVRLDNREELRSALSAPVRVGDVSLLRDAYLRWGERCVDHLLGDFAFAVWDPRRRSLLAARDHIGVRPLVYYRSADLVAFASEARALFALAEVPRRPNELMIAYSLVDFLEDASLTFFEGVQRLPPAHTVEFGRPGSAPRRYWSVDAGYELRLGSDREYEEAFRSTFFEAVRCRVRAGGRIGAELSGGLDSSSVASIARSLIGSTEPLPTFTAAFDDPESDERQYVDAVLSRGGFEPWVIDGSQIAVAGAVQEAVRAQGEPFGSPSVLMEAALYASARDHGVQVVLDGFDGDTVVSHGLGRLTELLRRGKVLELTHEVAVYASATESSALDVWKQEILAPLVPEPLLALRRKLLGRPSDGLLAGSLVNRELARRLDLEGRIKAMAFLERRRPRSARVEHARDVESGLNAVALEIRDRAAAVAGIELRHPFFDRRLVELCVALPSEQKFRDGATRSILRRALRSLVPETVLGRPGKATLSSGFVTACLSSESAALGTVTGADAPVRRYLEPSAIGRVASSRSFVRVDSALAVWHALCLDLWLRQDRFD